MANTWQASSARHRFTDLVDAAVEGEPQFVKRRDGREVVVVSREYYDKTQPTLASYLLASGVAANGEDALDRALQAMDAEGSPFLIAGSPDLSK